MRRCSIPARVAAYERDELSACRGLEPTSGDGLLTAYHPDYTYPTLKGTLGDGGCDGIGAMMTILRSRGMAGYVMQLACGLGEESVIGSNPEQLSPLAG